MSRGLCITSNIHLLCQGERQALLLEALEKAPPRSYLEAMAVLLKWLGDIEFVLQSEKVQTGSLRVMNHKLEIYKVSSAFACVCVCTCVWSWCLRFVSVFSTCPGV